MFLLHSLLCQKLRDLLETDGICVVGSFLSGLCQYHDVAYGHRTHPTGKGTAVAVVLFPKMLQRIFLCEHTGVRTLIISVLEFSLRRFIRPETVVYISDCRDLVDFIGADLGADFRRSGNIGIAAAFLHFCKLANMIGGVADADMAIVDVLAGENHLFTVKASDDDAFPVLDGKERVVTADLKLESSI